MSATGPRATAGEARPFGHDVASSRTEPTAMATDAMAAASGK
jgi:hypothetical protein